MKKIVAGFVLSTLVGMAFSPSVARADFFDNFESYSLGNVNGQGPWVDFGGALPTNVSSAQALSGTKSLAFSTVAATGAYGSDSYIANLNGAPVTSGIWVASVDMYIPSAFNGQFHLFFSQDSMPNNFDEGAWVRVNNNAGQGNINRFNVVNGATPASLVYDQWSNLNLLINVDANTLGLSYNGVNFHNGVWDAQFPGGFKGIGGIDFWVDSGSNPGGTVFIDNLSLTAIPEPTTMAISAVALLGLGGLRRKR